MGWLQIGKQILKPPGAFHSIPRDSVYFFDYKSCSDLCDSPYYFTEGEPSVKSIVALCFCSYAFGYGTRTRLRVSPIEFGVRDWRMSL